MAPRSIAAVLLTFITIVVFALVLRPQSGQVDSDACDVYCGPSNVVVASGLLLLLPLVWVVAAVATGLAAYARSRAVALSCGTALLVPVGVLVAMYVSTH